MMTKIFQSLLPFLLFVQICSSKSDDIAVYWGDGDGGLNETCATGEYSFVVIGRLKCAPSFSSGCSTSGTEIKYCQQQGIKIMLSLGALHLNSSDDVQKVFDYLWNNFLGGSSSSQRPFGDAILDGIDFDASESAPHVEDLARYLKSHSTDSQKLYLSAECGCSFPSAKFPTAVKKGLFDYVWVDASMRMSCEYSEDNRSSFFNRWNQWTTSLLNKSKIFLKLPPSPESPFETYIPADLLMSEILPTVRTSPNYGGVMLSSVDPSSGYSRYLHLCTTQSAPKCRNHDSGFEERLGYMSYASIEVYGSEVADGRCCETICRNNCSCVAYAPLSQRSKKGCQIWLNGARFTEDAGKKGRSFYIVKHKGMPCFLTCAKL